jgi:hypothetical protein
MVGKRRYHFNVGEVKSGIIEFILGRKELIGEPFIRRSLQEKYDGIDQGTANRHLHDLQKLGCLDLIPPSKKTTRANRWSITTLKQLENIRQHFPDIQLNRYEKSLDIVSRYHLHLINPVRVIIFRVQLLLSTSFFDLCIKNDTETFYAKASEIYRFGKGFEDDLQIQGYREDTYTKLTNIIFKDSNFLLSVWNKQLDSLKTGVYPDPSKYILDIEISEETFNHILDFKDLPLDKSPEEVRGLELVELMSLKISRKIFQNSLKEIYENFPKNAKKLLFNIKDDIFNKIIEENPQELYHKIVTMNDYQLEIRDKILSIIFEHCFEADILNNTVSDEEKEFMKRIKSSVQEDKEGIISYDEWYIRSKLDASGDGMTMSEYTAYDNLYDEYLKKYMITYLEAS